MDWRVVLLVACVVAALIALLAIRNKTFVASWHPNQAFLVGTAVALIGTAVAIGLNLNGDLAKNSTSPVSSLNPGSTTSQPSAQRRNIPFEQAPITNAQPTTQPGPSNSSVPYSPPPSPPEELNATPASRAANAAGDAGDSRDALNAAAIGAATVRDWRQVEQLLDRGADANAQDSEGRTLLIWSIAWPDSSNGTDLSAPTMLIKHGANVNYRMPNCAACARPSLGVPTVAGFTPLHYAAWSGDQPLAALLVEAGAQLDTADDAGRSPLYAAIDLGQDNVATYLLQHGASAPNAIQLANARGNTDMKKWFNAHGYPN